MFCSVQSSDPPLALFGFSQASKTPQGAKETLSDLEAR
jgi:hypothetical protein